MHQFKSIIGGGSHNQDLVTLVDKADRLDQWLSHATMLAFNDCIMHSRTVHACMNAVFIRYRRLACFGWMAF